MNEGVRLQKFWDQKNSVLYGDITVASLKRRTFIVPSTYIQHEGRGEVLYNLSKISL